MSAVSPLQIHRRNIKAEQTTTPEQEETINQHTTCFVLCNFGGVKLCQRNLHRNAYAFAKHLQPQCKHPNTDEVCVQTHRYCSEGMLYRGPSACKQRSGVVDTYNFLGVVHQGA